MIRLLRAMGIRTVLTALGATGSVLGNLMIRREAKTRVCLTGGEVEGMDLGKIFPGVKGLKVDQAPYKGAGFMGTPESPAGLFKNWRILPEPDPRHRHRHHRAASAAGQDLPTGGRHAYASRWDAGPHRMDAPHGPHSTPHGDRPGSGERGRVEPLRPPGPAAAHQPVPGRRGRAGAEVP